VEAEAAALRVPVEGVDRQVDLGDGGVVGEELGRPAAAVRVEVDDQDRAGARADGAPRSEREAVEGAEARAARSSRVVETGRERARGPRPSREGA
jgi:hypothetical protein